MNPLSNEVYIYISENPDISLPTIFKDLVVSQKMTHIMLRTALRELIDLRVIQQIKDGDRETYKLSSAEEIMNPPEHA